MKVKVMQVGPIGTNCYILEDEATNKAENSIPKLKSVTEHSSEDLKEVIDSAKNLKDDLTFINERADNLADRLENE